MSNNTLTFGRPYNSQSRRSVRDANSHLKQNKQASSSIALAFGTVRVESALKSNPYLDRPCYPSED